MDNGYAYVGIFGCNIVATKPGYMYVNDLVTCTMPDQTAIAGLPLGALYYCNSNCAVYVNY